MERMFKYAGQFPSSETIINTILGMTVTDDHMLIRTKSTPFRGAFFSKWMNLGYMLGDK